MKQNLKIYHDLLLKWQKQINLISNNTIGNSWERHFEDSLQMLEFIPIRTKNLLDLGSGAGFPGLVIAIEKPEIHVTLIEADQKKCSFLKTVSRETSTNITVINNRIENSTIDFMPDIISARALASLDKLFHYCCKWIEINPNLQLIFPKGQNFENELEECAINWSFDKAIHKSKIDENSVILVFTNVTKNSDGIKN